MANPFVIFLLTRSVLIASVTTCLSVIAIQGAIRRPGRSLLAAYLFNALAIASLVAHADVLLTYIYPEHVIPNLYSIKDGYYFNRPFIDQVFVTDEYRASYRTNAQGFRIGALHDPAREVNAVDWLVMGDSFTQGAQVEFEELFSTRLNSRFPDKIVLNVGISGMGIAQEYNYFVKQGRQLGPKLVILQIGSFNDFMNVEPREASLAERLMTGSASIRWVLNTVGLDAQPRLPLGRWTEPFYPDYRSNSTYNIFFRHASPAKEQDLKTFRSYLQRLQTAVEASGAQLLVLLLPTREQVYPGSLEEVLTAFRIERAHVDMRRPNDILRALADELNIELLDLLLFFEAAGGRLFFDRDEHLTARGHEVMAEALGDYLQAKLGPSRATLLGTESHGARYPSFSRDGSLLTYQSVRDGRMDLFVSDASLHDVRRLTASGLDESHPMLSRDNTTVMFTAGAAESFRTEVVTMRVDGTSRRVVTAEPEVFGAIATYSPSDDRIALAEWTCEPSPGLCSNPRIVLRDLPSGSRQPITPEHRESWRPVFSPDGRSVVYISKVRSQFDLYSYDLTSGRERQLTDTPHDEWDPQFSPDGAQLVYAARADGNWDLFVLDLLTGVSRQLTRTLGDEWDPSFSPDGGTLLFAGRFGLAESMFRMSRPR